MSKRDAYHIFANNTREEVKAANPTMPVWEVNSKLGAMWRDMEETDRAHYVGLQTARERVAGLRTYRAMLAEQFARPTPATARPTLTMDYADMLR